MFDDDVHTSRHCCRNQHGCPPPHTHSHTVHVGNHADLEEEHTFPLRSRCHACTRMAESHRTVASGTYTHDIYTSSIVSCALWYCCSRQVECWGLRMYPFLPPSLTHSALSCVRVRIYFLTTLCLAQSLILVRALPPPCTDSRAGVNVSMLCTRTGADGASRQGLLGATTHSRDAHIGE